MKAIRINIIMATFVGVLLVLSFSIAKSDDALIDLSQPDSQQVVLKLTAPVTYKIFNLKNPERVFVYLYGIGIQTPKRDVQGFGDYVKYAKIYPFEGNFGTVRVEIVIAEGMQTRDWAVDNEIHIWVGRQSDSPPPPPPPSAPTESPAEEAPYAPVPETPSPTNVVPTPIAGSQTALATRFMARPGTAPRATKALDIVITGGSRITINTDGPLRAFDAFLLTAPSRIVVDVLDVKADFVAPSIAVGSQAVSSVRWGPHKDRIRIVIDLAGAGPAPYFQARKNASGVEIVINPAMTTADAPESDFKTYTVTAGESLQDIARKTYGDPRAWRGIVSANRNVLAGADDLLDSEGTMFLTVGTVLRLPLR